MTNTKIHQGAAVKAWAKKKYDSINNFAVTVIEGVPDEEIAKNLSRIVGLMRSIAQSEFIKTSLHERWRVEVAPALGFELKDVLKDIGETHDRSIGHVTNDTMKDYYILQGKYEAVKEQNRFILTEFRDILMTMKTN